MKENDARKPLDEQFDGTVTQALDTGDFRELNALVTDTTQRAVSEARRQAEAEKRYRSEHVRRQSEEWKARQRGENVPRTEQSPLDVNNPVQLAREAGQLAQSRTETDSARIASIICGGLGIGVTAVTLLVALFSHLVFGGGLGWLIASAVLGVGSALLLRSGIRKNAHQKKAAGELRLEEHTGDGESLSGQVDAERRTRQSELDAAVAEGKEYIRRVRELNDRIPDEKLSQEMYEMEGLLKEIFNALKDHPDQLPRTRKLMKYYLPTTIKLLEGYRDFDNVSTPDTHIREAKVEIEKTLELINEAYREILNSLFREGALDVTTDAQVLQTMLAKDGLTRELEPAWAQTADEPQTQQKVMN